MASAPDQGLRRSGNAGRRVAGLAGLAIAVLAAGWAFDQHYRFFDMAIYQGALRWWTAGGELYGYEAPVRGRLGFTYPPFAAVLLMPVATMSLTAAGWLNAGASLLALGVVLHVVIRRTDLGRGASPGLVLTAAVVLAAATEPVRQTLGLGQINLLLLALIVLDIGVLARSDSRWAGAGVGIATAIKLTPGLFIVYLLVTRRWRMTGVAIGAATAATAATLPLAPEESVRYFTELLWQTGRVGTPDAVANQALSGLLARLPDATTSSGGWWLAASALILVAGLCRARRAHDAGDEISALTVVGLTANLISPISWTHHLLFLPIAVLLLADSGRRCRIVTAAVGYGICVLSPIWVAGNAPGGVAGFIAGNTFALMMIALVLRLPIRARPPGAAETACSPLATGSSSGQDASTRVSRSQFARSAISWRTAAVIARVKVTSRWTASTISTPALGSAVASSLPTSRSPYRIGSAQ
jgi:alpha-1,2-mannosyltransferase